MVTASDESSSESGVHGFALFLGVFSLVLAFIFALISIRLYIVYSRDPENQHPFKYHELERMEQARVQAEKDRLKRKLEGDSTDNNAEQMV